MFTKTSLAFLLVLLIGAIVLTLAPDFHPEAKLGMQYSLWSDLLVHGGSYFVSVIILFCFIGNRKLLLNLSAYILLFSLLLEICQIWIPGRSGSVFDFFCNCLGTGSALLLHLSFRKLKTIKQ